MDWWREKKKKKKKKKRSLKGGAKLLEELIECCDGKSNPIKFFSSHQILKATNNFNDSNFVFGSLFYGPWFTGKNENHPMILIRKIVALNGNFCRDVAISSMVSGHKNFMKLVGCCLEFEDPVLVYNGVKKHYELNLSEQPWKRRMKIAEDIATALAYLHTAFPRPFVYRIMSLENILLDEDGVAKLNDFSYCVSIPKGETFVKVDRNYNGNSYMDRKYLRDGIVSVETDVYAIGMLMQVLLHGWNSIIETDVERRHNQNWLLKLMGEERMDEIADPKRLENMGEISEEELCQMIDFLMLSQRCIGLREKVPTMVEVAKELKRIQRSLKNDSSSQFDSPQDIASSSQTRF